MDAYALVADGAAELASSYNEFFHDLSDSMYRRASALKNSGSNLRYASENYGWADQLKPPADPPSRPNYGELPDPWTGSVMFNATLDLLGLSDDYERRLTEMQQACLYTAKRLRQLQPEVDAVEGEVRKARWGGEAAQTYHAAWTRYINPAGGANEAQPLEMWARRSDQAAEILGNAVEETQKYKGIVKATLEVLAVIGAILVGAVILNPAVRLYLRNLFTQLRTHAVRMIKLLATRLKVLARAFAKSVGGRKPVVGEFNFNGFGVVGANYVNSALANWGRGVDDPAAISPSMAGTLLFLFGLGGSFGLLKRIGAVTRLAQTHPLAFNMAVELGINAGAATALSMMFEKKGFNAALQDGLIVGGTSAIFGAGYYGLLRNGTGLKHLAWRKADKWGVKKLGPADPSRPMSATNVRYATPNGTRLAQMKADGSDIYVPKNSITYRARQIGPVNAFLNMDPFWKGRILGLLPGTINYTLVPRGQSEAPELTVPNYRNWDNNPQPQPSQPNATPPVGAATHTVRSGETLWDIAQREYGDGTYASLLMQANWQLDGINQGNLSPGAQLIIPELRKDA
ncbi:LysM peptidoglycan-binding domain-containing protein [Nonomuraea sp. NPDC049400]|uniref:LysM peptidoglycan-binding domain-containing protein n=1 Tax=Nonomuraea sp. NPDC049400 TaxID=3364352 RepID=UPI0037AE1B42